MARSPPRRRHNGHHPRDHRDNNRGDPVRSFSRDRRYDDRDRERGHHDDRRDRARDRDRDRYDDHHYSRHNGHRSPPRRDRSRDRKRSRSPVRESRRHSRDGHHRDRDRDRDRVDYDDRDRKRRRRGSTVNRSQVSPPPEANHLRLVLNGKSPRLSAAEAEAAAAEQAKMAEKLAKVEAWKKSRLESQNISNVRPTLDSPVPSATSPIVDSPAASHATTANGSPAPLPENLLLPDGPRTKFDHKEIKKRAAEKLSQGKKGTLGGDVVLPTHANGNLDSSAAAGSQNRGLLQAKAPKLKPSDGKISGFGLNTSNVNSSTEKNAGEKNPTASALDDDENVKRQFRKLPDLPRGAAAADSPFANEDDQNVDLADDLRSDDEEAEAAREALERRAKGAETKQEDVEMTDADAPSSTMLVETSTAASGQADGTEVDEEIDPLDAFMNNLEQPAASDPWRLPTGLRKDRGPQLFSTDDEPFADAVAIDEDPKDLLNNPKRNKKDIPIVDHSKMEYADFRKDFYNQAIEVAELNNEEVQALRMEMENITVHGQNVPTPISKWSQGGFSAQILDVIRGQNFEAPTSIQSQALPAIMSGRDTIGIAKTGSGKTLAFILPMFRHIQDQPRVSGMDGPIGLILAPTRELAAQIHRECKPYLNALKLRGVCAYGGAPIKEQIAELKRGTEVLVCTPGRFIDLLSANGGRVTNLARVTYCVLDEADRMFDMGFEPQITRILNNIRPNRQTVLFSATFPPKMESLARKHTQMPIQITVGGRSVVAPEIEQSVEVRSEQSKFHRVLELLGKFLYADDGTRVLIFVERQETADGMLRDLGKHGYPSVSVHGGREQIDRDQAISDFKAGHIPIMVATSVAARGLDVKQLNLVINYDSPNHGEDYVHRVGRTGRAGNKGTAVTFLTPEQEPYSYFLLRHLQESGQEVSEVLQEMSKSYKAKVKSGELKWNGSGFGGKGIERLDAARDAERARERRQFKTADEPDEEDEAETKKLDAKKSEVDKLVAQAAGTVKDRDAEPQDPKMPANLDTLLSNAMKVHKVEKTATPDITDPLARVAAIAAQISNRIGAKGSARPGAPADNRGPDAGAFHATLELNDFPQKARWAVTNRTNVAKILEATGTSITSKGNYYPAGTQPGPGDPPKLYVLVEGDTEIAVSAAMRDLTRNLTEGTLQAQEIEARGGGGGRYNVL